MSAMKNIKGLVIGSILLIGVGVAIGWFAAVSRQPGMQERLRTTNESSLGSLLNAPVNEAVEPVVEKVRTTLQGVVVEVGSDKLVIKAPTYENMKLVGPQATLTVSDQTVLTAKVPNAGVSAPSGSDGAPPRPMEAPTEAFRDLPISLNDLKVNDLVEFTVTEEMKPDIVVEPESIVWIAAIVRVETGDKVVVATEGRFSAEPTGTAPSPSPNVGHDAPAPGPRPK